jgi:hypothetical protein
MALTLVFEFEVLFRGIHIVMRKHGRQVWIYILKDQYQSAFRELSL